MHKFGHPHLTISVSLIKTMTNKKNVKIVKAKKKCCQEKKMKRGKEQGKGRKVRVHRGEGQEDSWINIGRNQKPKQ